MSIFIMIVYYLMYQRARNDSALSREWSALWKKKQYYPTNKKAQVGIMKKPLIANYLDINNLTKNRQN